MKPLISYLFSVLVIFCFVFCSPVVRRAESESVGKQVTGGAPGEVVDIAGYGRKFSGRLYYQGKETL